MLTFLKKLFSSLLAVLFGPAPIVVPVEDTQTQKVAAVILKQNNSFPYVGGKLKNPLKGTDIHEITEAQAAQIAADTISAASKYDLPLPYFMASLCIESEFDPNCENGNFEGSNPTKAADGYDDGIGQTKLKYLIGSEGVTNVAQAQAFAFNPDKDIPYTASLIAGKIEAAVAFIANKLTDATINPIYKNQFVVAALFYNFGETGGAKIVLSNPPMPSHAAHIRDYEKVFAAALGLPTVMPQ